MKERILECLRGADTFLSGEELSRRFGVSRTSIWKAIRQLTQEGYDIEAVRNKGYRLLDEPDLLREKDIRAALNTRWAAGSLAIFDAVDSTNNEAKRRAEDGAPHGLLVLGEEQTAGRGRRGRDWDSKKGDGIYMSLLLKPQMAPGNASMLTLVMGLAVREALAEAGVPSPMIKWPNDIVAEGKKLCGILTEMSAQIDCINYIVIGVGINVHQQSFPPELAEKATSLDLLLSDVPRRSTIVAAVMGHFEKYYECFLKTEDLQELKELYETHLVNCHRPVRVLDQKAPFTGTALGINAAGELLVATEDRVVAVASGEVSVRGIYGYV